MTKHIHIHLHRGSVVRDAGFDESKHKRDHGKFSTTSGPNGGDHEHHFKQGEHHAAEYAKLKGSAAVSQRQAAQAHLDASNAHHNASEHLKAGDPQKAAQGFANEANKHALKAANLRGGQGTAPIPKPQANSSGVPVKHQPSGTTVPHAKAHLKPGGEVFTTHRNTPFKATYIGPDHGAGPNHHEIKVGNSRVSVPEHDLHATREAAHKFNGG